MRARVIAFIAFACMMAALTAFAAPDPVTASDEDALPEEALVIAAVKAMFADPLSPKAAEAAKTVMEFSQGSDKVVVIVARDLGFYPGSDYSDMLLAQYIAGVVKFDLENPKQASDERLGIQAGLQAALNAYRKIRSQRPSFSIAALDTAETSMKKGQLAEFIGEALARAKQERLTAK
jgi:hypothetical protein